MTNKTEIDDEIAYRGRNSKFSRWYCEPCHANKDNIIDLCEELTKNQNGRGSVKLEFYIKSRQYSNGMYSIAIFQVINNVPPENLEEDQIDENHLSIDSIVYAKLADQCDDEKEAISYENYKIDDSFIDYLCLFDQLQEKLRNINVNNRLKPLEDNEFSFPKKIFSGLKSTIPLRIGKVIPKEVGDRYVFTYSEESEKNYILKNFEYFASKTPFTHFLALPIAPNFPEWTAAMKTILARWDVNVRNTINRTHLTLALFVINNDDELNLVNQIASETINEIQWPEDNILKTPKLGYFGSSKNATILFIEPEKNEFVEALSKFIISFVSKLSDHGFSYVEEDSKALHVTMIRPNFVTKGRTFNPTKYLEDFGPDELPPIHIQELRLVQRFIYDDDDFYKTHFHYSLYKSKQENTNDKEHNEESNGM